MDVVARYMDTPERRVLDLRPVGIAHIPMLGVYNYSFARPDLPVHRHAGGMEICYLYRGNQIFEVGGRNYHLHGGEVFVTFPDEPHSTGGAPSEPGILYWINVRIPRRGQSLLGLPGRESDSVIQGLLHLPERHFQATRATKTCFNELLKLYDSPHLPYRRSRLRLAVIRLLLEILDGAQRHASAGGSPRMRDLVRFLREHPEEEFSLQDLARRVHVSLSHFKRVFKAETGLSPRQFLLQGKIDEAKRRLVQPGASVTRIALELGFVSSQYFATVFRRMTGTTPTAYRREGEPRLASRRRHDGQG